MTTLTADAMQVFRGDEPGFELDASVGVTVHPLLTSADGHTIDVFYLSLERGREVTPESHPFSETLIVLTGRLACAAEGTDTVVDEGQIWHIPANASHHVRNIGGGRAVAAMLIGV
jgi:quercetin dioxygenase-like cupin family protein